MKQAQSRGNRIYRLLIALAGIAYLAIHPLQTSFSGVDIESAIILILFIALQLIFPLTFFPSQYSLIQWTALGAGLIFGPIMVGWAALLGTALGSFMQGFLRQGWTPGDRNHRYSSWYGGYLFASITIPLMVAFLLLQQETASPILGNVLLQPWQSALAICLVCAVLHGTIFLVDTQTYTKNAVPLSLRKSLIFAALEIVPIPFVILMAQSYASIGSGAVVMLGSTFTATGLLLARNERTSNELQRRRQDLTTLNHVSSTLRSTLEMEKLLETIRAQVTNLLGVDNFYVALYDAAEEQIWYPLAVKHGEPQDWPRRPLTNRLTDRVIQESRPILLGRYAGDILARIGLPAGEDSPFAWMGVPLITSNKTIGCLALFSLSEKVEFAQADIDLLTILSGQTSVAIENALLYQSVRQRAAQLESLVHDLRSPISTVVSAIDVIEDSSSIPEDDRLSKQALRIARRSARRVLGMVESILDISKFQADAPILNRAPLDIKKLSVQTLEEFLMQANEFGILIKDEVPHDLAKAYADERKIKRVITNLLDNALKHTPSGGQIVLSAAECDQDMVMLSVSDTGPGIPEEHRYKIFERFGQIPGQHRREQGYGLGLTYCRLAIEAHGGRIWVEPGSGGGSVFSITLPLAENSHPGPVNFPD